MNSIRIVARDYAIVHDIAVDRLKILADIQRRHFPEAKADGNAHVKVATRLRRRQFLERYPLFGKVCYYKTGYRAVTLGLPWTKGPYGANALPRIFAASAYLTRGSVSGTRLSRQEMTEQFPWLTGHGEVTFFREGDGVGAILVDQGGTEFHLANRLRRFFDNHFPSISFRDALAQNRFRMVLVTSTPARAQQVQRTMQNEPRPVPMTFVDIPELIHFTWRTKHVAS